MCGEIPDLRGIASQLGIGVGIGSMRGKRGEFYTYIIKTTDKCFFGRFPDNMDIETFSRLLRILPITFQYV